LKMIGAATRKLRARILSPLFALKINVMKLTDEAKAIIEAHRLDYLNMKQWAVLAWFEWGLNNPELLAAQGLAPSEMSRTEKEFAAVMAVWQEIDDYWREEVKKNWELNQELATLTEQVADYREALEKIAKQNNPYNTWDYEAKEGRYIARAVLDKYRKP
jgi:Ni,Fe-hydrogenase I large subunit